MPEEKLRYFPVRLFGMLESLTGCFNVVDSKRTNKDFSYPTSNNAKKFLQGNLLLFYEKVRLKKLKEAAIHFRSISIHT